MSALAVSVVIAAYNAADTIGTTLESLSRQTFTDWEALVVDDGSTDATARRVRRFARGESRVRLVRQPNAGVCGARNAGLQVAKGELVLFLDADDWIEPDHLDQMVSAQRRAGTQAVYCGYRRVAPNGRRLEACFARDIETAPFRTFAQHCFVAIHCVLVDRALVIAVGGFDPTLRTCEDWDLWQRLARSGARFTGVDRPLALYRMRPGSLSTDFAAMARDGLTVLRRGAGRDARLPCALPEHEGGHTEHAPAATAYFALWCAAATAAAGGDPDLILIEHPGVLGAFLDYEGVRGVLREAVLVGANSAPLHAARAWAEAAPRLVAVLNSVTVAPSERGFVHLLEAGLAREDALRTPLRLLTVYAERIEVGAFRSIEPKPGTQLLRLVVQANGSTLCSLELPAWGALSAADVAAQVIDQLGPTAVLRLGGYRRRWRFFVALARVLPSVAVRAGLSKSQRGRRRAVVEGACRAALLRLCSESVIGRRATDVISEVKARADGEAPSVREIAAHLSRPATTTAPSQDWDQVFEQEDPWGYTTPYETLKYDQTMQLLGGRRFASALEVGCAEGRFTHALAGHVDRLTAVDISHVALGRARRRCSGRGDVTFERLDVTLDALPGGLDLIVCSEILYYVDDVAALTAVTAKLAAALAPGGRLVAAHAFTCSDSPSRTGFDWGSPFGAETISRTFAMTPGLVLEASLETELYRIDLWRAAGSDGVAPVMMAGELVLPEPKVQCSIIWGGVVSRREEACAALMTCRVPILMYHRIGQAGRSPLARYATAPDVFEQQLRLLRRHGFYALTSGELSWFRERREPLRGRPVLITFDDGYRDFHELAWPILERNGLRAEVFLVTDLVGGRAEWDAIYGEPAPLLSWDEIAELSEAGVRFGSHMATHQSCAALTCPEILDEALRSRRTLEQRLGDRVISLAAPFGALDARSAEIVSEAGYKLAFTTHPGTSSFDDPSLQLPRIEVWNGMPLDDFAIAVGVA